ncbi:MAG: phage baseplate assembly protein gpV, partial [Flavobacteriaceae bacterium]
VPSLRTVPSTSTTEQLAAINDGAAVLYAQTFHSVDVCGPSGSAFVFTASGTVVLQPTSKTVTNNKSIFFIIFF